MKTKFLSVSILCFGLVLSTSIITNGASAQTTNIHYPIAELGNCKSKDACKAYCDNTKNIDACVTFAEKNNMMSPNQLAEAKQVQSAIEKGIKPPACNGKEECDAYCEEPSHMKECISFGEASGFLKGKELEDAKKMITAIDNGATPPACKGKEACDAYCSDRSHIEACMTFSQAAGLMTPEEAQNSQKMLDAIKKGVMPPNCSGKEACDAYCVEPTHTDECINFSIAAGFMTDKEAEMAKKTGGKGPGGCVGKDACDSFCNNQDNQKTCMNFAKDNGMISEEEAQRMQEGQQKFKESMQNLPEEVASCMREVFGDDSFEKIKSGQTMPPKDMPSKVDTCFSKMGPPQEGQPGEGGDIPPAGQGKGQMKGQQGGGFKPTTENGGTDASIRIGNCKNLGECTAYCESHQTECQKLGVPDTQECVSGMPGYDMEKCQSYCSDHQELCDLARYNARRGGNSKQENRQSEQGNQQGESINQQQQPNQQRQPQQQNQQPNQQQNQQQQQQSGQFAPGTYQDQSKSSGQYGSGTYPNQPPPPEGQQQQPPQGEQFAPGTYPNQPPPPEGQQAPGTLFVPKIEMNNQTQQPEGSSQVPQVAPIEQTASQSFNFNLNSALSAVITAFQKSKF